MPPPPLVVSVREVPISFRNSDGADLIVRSLPLTCGRREFVSNRGEGSFSCSDCVTRILVCYDLFVLSALLVHGWLRELDRFGREALPPFLYCKCIALFGL